MADTMTVAYEGHQIIRKSGKWICDVCKQEWVSRPTGKCPGFEVLSWEVIHAAGDRYQTAQWLVDHGFLVPDNFVGLKRQAGKITYIEVYDTVDAAPDPNPVPEGKHRLGSNDCCIFCDRHFVYGKAYGECPRVKIYSYDQWPAGHLTERQLKAKHLVPGPVRGAVWYQSKKVEGHWLWLYREDEATPNPLTEKQIAAREKALATKLANATCKLCHRVKLYKLPDHICGDCRRVNEEIQWARNLLLGKFFILDFETTGLEGSEIIQIGLVDQDGNVLINSYVKPVNPIVEVAFDSDAAEEEPWRRNAGVTAFGVNGITNAMVADAPTYPEIFPKLRDLLRGQVVMAYNADFEKGRLRDARHLHQLERIGVKDWQDAMTSYARFYGEVRETRRSWDWKWQSLGAACQQMKIEGGDHNAADDCLATLRLIKAMAATPLKGEEKEGIKTDG